MKKHPSFLELRIKLHKWVLNLFLKLINPRSRLVIWESQRLDRLISFSQSKKLYLYFLNTKN